MIRRRSFALFQRFEVIQVVTGAELSSSKYIARSFARKFRANDKIL
jgi:hypothetical protein